MGGYLGFVYRFFRFFSGAGRSAVALVFFFEVSADGPNDGFEGFAFGSLRCLKARLMRPMQSRVAPETHARNTTRTPGKECPPMQRASIVIDLAQFGMGSPAIRLQAALYTTGPQCSSSTVDVPPPPRRASFIWYFYLDFDKDPVQRFAAWLGHAANRSEYGAVWRIYDNCVSTMPTSKIVSRYHLFALWRSRFNGGNLWVTCECSQQAIIFIPPQSSRRGRWKWAPFPFALRHC